MGKALPLSDRFTKTFTISRASRRYLIVSAIAILLVIIVLTVGRHYLLVPVSPGDGTNSDTSDPDEIPIAREANYYVDVNNGNDDYDGRTTDTPFKTIHKAASVVQPSDVVHVREGVYVFDTSLRITTSGTSNSPIIFEAYPGETPVLDGGDVSMNEWGELISVYANWNVFRGFEECDSRGTGFYVTGDNNILEDIETHHNYLSGIQVVGGDQNQFFRIRSHHNYDPGSNGWHADGISISSGTGNEFHQCVCWENSDDGFDTWLSSDTLLDCCMSFHNGYDDGDGNGFKLGQNGHVTVTRCIAFDNGMDGGTSDPITGFTNNVDGVQIVVDHCTALNNRDSDYEDYLNNEWRNSIGGWMQTWGSGNPTESHNSWNLGIDDPKYISTDPNSPDFLALRSDSPCRGAASDGSDIGALQYGERITDICPVWEPQV